MMTRTFGTLCALGAGVGLSIFACQSDKTNQGGYGGELQVTTTSTHSTSSSTTSTSSSTTSSSTTTSTTTDTGGSGGSACQDTGGGEPANNNAPQAVDLGAMTDADPNPLPTFHGVVAGPSDVDWYTYTGTDELASFVDPERIMDPNATNVRMCAYYWCTSTLAWGPPAIGDQSGSGGAGGAGPSCPPGTTLDQQDFTGVQYGGQNLGPTPGCCTQPGTLSMHLGNDLINTYWPLTCNDPTSDDDMVVLMKIDAFPSSPAGMCVPYTVQYHF